MPIIKNFFSNLPLIKEKITVIVPAWNEQENIAGVLKPLIEWKRAGPKRREVVVIDDGSRDKTAEIAKKMGVKVIPSDPIKGRNLGKGQAFLAGAKHAKQINSTILISLDADLINLQPKQITEFALELKRKKTYMLTATTIEGETKIETSAVSGQRAFKMQALEPLLRGNRKWLETIKGYGLENALNRLIRKHDGSIKIEFQSLEPFRKNQGEGQSRETAKSGVIFNKREQLARKLKELRREGKRLEATFLLKRGRKILYKTKRGLP